MKKSNSLKFLGPEAKKVYQEPDIEHLMFYQCLILSSSYAIAYRIRSNQLRKTETVPKDIDIVLKIYDQVGNIYKKPFEKWWKKIGNGLFYEKKPIKKLTLNLNLQKNTEDLLTQVKKAIHQAKKINFKDSDKGISFEINKLRPVSIFYRLFLVVDRCNYIEEKRNIPYWKMATEMNFPSQQVEALNKGIKNIDEANKAREYVSMLVCRKLSEAKFLTENAARGIFPSIKPFPTAIDFDFIKLPKIVHEQEITEIMHMENQRWSNKPVLQWDYASVLIKNIQKQKKKNKQILAKAKKISESKNPIFKLN